MLPMHHILIVEPNRERYAVDHLCDRGFEAYSPIIHKRRSYRGKVVEDVRPMFTSYAFVKAPVAFTSVERVPGVRSFMRVQGCPVSLSQEAIDAVKAQEDFELRRHEAHSRKAAFEVGQLVQILIGPFANILGNVSALDDRGRVQVMLDLFGAQRPSWVQHSELIAA